jgi:hypothetical protein
VSFRRFVSLVLPLGYQLDLSSSCSRVCISVGASCFCPVLGMPGSHDMSLTSIFSPGLCNGGSLCFLPPNNP